MTKLEITTFTGITKSKKDKGTSGTEPLVSNLRLWLTEMRWTYADLITVTVCAQQKIKKKSTLIIYSTTAGNSGINLLMLISSILYVCE